LYGTLVIEGVALWRPSISALVGSGFEDYR